MIGICFEDVKCSEAEIVVQNDENWANVPLVKTINGRKQYSSWYVPPYTPAVRFKLDGQWRQTASPAQITTKQGYDLFYAGLPTTVYPVRGEAEQPFTTDVIPAGASTIRWTYPFIDAGNNERGDYIIQFLFPQFIMASGFQKPNGFIDWKGYYRSTSTGKNGYVYADYEVFTPTWRKLDEAEETSVSTIPEPDNVVCRVYIKASNGLVTHNNDTILVTPDLVGTWETEEEVVIETSIPDVYEGTVIGSQYNIQLDPEPDPPVETTSKIRITVEAIED